MSSENADSLKFTSYWFFLIIAFFSSKSSYKKGDALFGASPNVFRTNVWLCFVLFHHACM